MLKPYSYSRLLHQVSIPTTTKTIFGLQPLFQPNMDSNHSHSVCQIHIPGSIQHQISDPATRASQILPTCQGKIRFQPLSKDMQVPYKDDSRQERQTGSVGSQDGVQDNKMP